MKKWKFVFFVSALSFLLDLIKIPFKSDLEFFDFMLAIFNGLSLFPIYGYAYQLAIGNKAIAIITFILNSIAALVAYSLFVWLAFNNPSTILFVGLGVVVLPIGLYLYPQFMYAFKSEQLWRQNA